MAVASKLPPQIIDLEDFTESMNWLIYGRSGAGKTVMGGQLPGRVLIIANEKGTIAAKRQGSKAKVWKIIQWEDLVQAYEWLANGGHEMFDWIVIDSVTDMQYKCIRWIMRNVVKAKPHRDIDIPAIDDHFKWQLSMKRMIVDFNDLPVNVLWTAQEMIREDPEGEDIVLPLIEGKDYQISSWVCAQMDVVGHLQLKPTIKTVGDKKVKSFVRRLTVNESPPVFAKDRFGVLGRVVDSPNIATMIKTVKDSETGRPARTASRTAARAGASKRTATPRKTAARKRTSA